MTSRQFCDARYKGVSSIGLGLLKFDAKAMRLGCDVILYAVRKQRIGNVCHGRALMVG